jgi:hypothetical protein
VRSLAVNEGGRLVFEICERAALAVVDVGNWVHVVCRCFPCFGRIGVRATRFVLQRGLAF